MDPKLTVRYLEDHRKTRMLLLLVAGLLLIGGTLLWSYMISRQEGREAKRPDGVAAPNAPLIAAKPPAKTPAAPGQSSGTGWGEQGAAPAGTSSTAAPDSSAPGLPVINTVNKAVNRAAQKSIDAANVTAQTAAPPAAGITAPVSAVAAPPSTTEASAPGSAVSATPRQTAIAAAKQEAGRHDPTAPISNYKHYPRYKTPEMAPEPSIKPELVPPPPPMSEGAMSPMPSGLSIDELPPPPSKPLLSDKMRLIAIIGDRAVLAFTDRRMQKAHKWPQTITMGHGDHFESINVVDVNGDSVTLDEDGERSVKTIGSVK